MFDQALEEEKDDGGVKSLTPFHNSDREIGPKNEMNQEKIFKMYGDESRRQN